MRKPKFSVEVGKNHRRAIEGAVRKRTEEGAVVVIVVGRKEVVVESADAREVEERSARVATSGEDTRVRVGRVVVEAGKKGFERRIAVNKGIKDKGTGFN